MRTIYCDEAGFTGNSLLDEDQPFFAYAAVNIEPEEAGRYLTQLHQDFQIPSGELKGSSLCKSKKGQAAVAKIIEDQAANSSVVVSNKRYALACKMFEYLMEPAVSGASKVLYDIGFNKFVANMIYCNMIVEGGLLLKSCSRCYEGLNRPLGQETLDEHEATTASFAGTGSEETKRCRCNAERRQGLGSRSASVGGERIDA